MSATPLPAPPPGRYPATEEELTARARALESLMLERSMLGNDTIDRIVSIYEHDIGPLHGAKVVARAWVDPLFKQRLLDDATAACLELGIGGMQGEHMVALENTDGVHHVIVCTLCSCYPWPVLGLPPTWYKDPAYRSRIVIEPRRVLADDFGLELEADTEVRVVDTSAVVRYFVIPRRPTGTEGLTAEELAGLITRDSLIGVAQVRTPT